ncbi:hypothetical protein [Saccharibacillus qingshengii]|uniref:hypothetical protein n=1 Tax=Saccharibacillus qingshengii TaxID=1763540 RepID=UPI00155282E4|nr:hypothetical protein [Saccharibacillus qingshengii]
MSWFWRRKKMTIEQMHKDNRLKMVFANPPSAEQLREGVRRQVEDFENPHVRTAKQLERFTAWAEKRS